MRGDNDDTMGRPVRLYRMVMADHVCPSGLKTLDRLKREGFEVEDHPKRSREETDAFNAEHGVETTPQVFIGTDRIGGYEDTLRRLGKAVGDDDATTYAPVIALFAMAAAMALAVSWATHGSVATIAAAEWLIAIRLCMLTLQ